MGTKEEPQPKGAPGQLRFSWELVNASELLERSGSSPGSGRRTGKGAIAWRTGLPKYPGFKCSCSCSKVAVWNPVCEVQLRKQYRPAMLPQWQSTRLQHLLLAMLLQALSAAMVFGWIKKFPKQWLHWRGSYGKGKGRVLIEVLALTRWFRLRRNAVLRFYVDFDCAGSHKVAVPIFTISKASFYRVFVYVFGHERHFAWQVQGICHMWRSETWVYVAGARNRTHCENRGRRSISWTLPKRWQACVIRRIVFYVAGAGKPHHGSYILRSKGSIPERCCTFGTWAWGCFCVACAAFRMTSAHDFVAGTVLLKHGFETWTLCGDRACRVRGMQVKLCFLISKCNPLRRSCVSSARNAGEIAFFGFEVQPSAEIVRVKCAECRWNCDFRFRSATLCGDSACPSREMLVKLRFL